MKRSTVITGIAGQDGSYLVELLLEKGYEVHGVVRREAIENPGEKLWRLQHVVSEVVLHPTSLDNSTGISRILAEVRPVECYHLAAHSFVSHSFEDDFGFMTSNINATVSVLTSIREVAPECRVCYAGSSEMFGHSAVTPQDETTPFNPRTPYGISKLAGLHITRTFRERHGIFACIGILFNHESPRRSLEFVTRKITHAAAMISLGMQSELKLGNLDAVRDWGYSGDYVRVMWLMLQQDHPDDYTVATGVPHTVREFAEAAFLEVGLDWRDFVRVDPQLYRQSELVPLVGDHTKVGRRLGWIPRVSFEELVTMMVRADVEKCRRQAAVPSAKF